MVHTYELLYLTTQISTKLSKNNIKYTNTCYKMYIFNSLCLQYFIKTIKIIFYKKHPNKNQKIIKKKKKKKIWMKNKKKKKKNRKK